ncbi:MAG: hypothetical protein EOP09_08595 [Proteobacteria bacterium]|nr:MAG: hypothetical protein EOP09_08595 [Pseudomonadota bacterium]
MKSIFIFIPFMIFATASLAQQNRPRPSVDNRTGYLVDQGVARGLVSVEYNSWFEKLKITDTATNTFQDSKAEYYGFSVNYERNFYYSTWGWGLGGGFGQGTAVGGEKAGTLQYFQARVPWATLRVMPRLFYRWNPQTDLGVDLMTLFKSAKWPGETDTKSVVSGSEVVAGAFIDLRVRFNVKLEMIQSFGMLYKDESSYWRLGLGYRL